MKNKKPVINPLHRNYDFANIDSTILGELQKKQKNPQSVFASPTDKSDNYIVIDNPYRAFYKGRLVKNKIITFPDGQKIRAEKMTFAIKKERPLLFYETGVIIFTSLTPLDINHIRFNNTVSYTSGTITVGNKK